MLTTCLLTLSVLFQLRPVDFAINPGDVQFTEFRGENALFIPGGVSPFNSGDPSLPGLNYSFVLPQGATLTDVNVEILAETSFPGIYRIAPVIATPLNEQIPSILPHSEQYMSPSFPSSPVQGLNTGTKTGFRIGSFSFVPFRWDPISGELTLVTEAVLSPVITQSSDYSPPLSEFQVEKAGELIEMMVQNPEMTHLCSPATAPDRSGAPWIVIADTMHQETMQPLVDLRAGTHGSEFVSTQWIYQTYDGRDTQEKIRNFLKDSFLNNGLVYALIVGDFGETTRLSSLNIGGNVMDSVTDLYFSDLDGTWDLDGDGQYGEHSDGLDYYSDIYIGRFSTDVPSRLETMVEKTVSYETAAPPGEWQTTALLAGAGLWVDDPPGYWGSFVCDSIALRIPESWTVHQLYEDYSSHPDNQIDLINEGVSYCTLNGHGNAAGVYWFYPPSTGIVTNANYHNMTNQGKPVVFHSMACHPGHLQDVACSAERLMFWPDGGGIAVMYNSHWGFGTPPAFGPSEWLELLFAEALLVDEQYELGVAHALSKDEFKATVTISMQKWVLQENNFLGDPALRFVAGQMVIEDEQGTTPIQPVLEAAYPNPTSGVLSVKYSLPQAEYAELSVYSIDGRIVAHLFAGELSEIAGSIQTDVGGLPSGMYRLLLRTETGAASTGILLLN